MGLVNDISRETQQKDVNISTYDEQFKVAKLDVIKRSAKRFLLNSENYTDFALRNPLIKSDAKKFKFQRQITQLICTVKYSEITNNDNTFSELTPNNPHSSTIVETTHIPHSLFAFNRPTNQLNKHSSKFMRIADCFQTVLMMSQSDETLSQIKHATPSKVCFADEVRPSTAPSAPITPSTQGTDISNVTTPSSDDFYTDTFNLALSKIFSSTLMASLTSKDAILKDVQDCLNTGNENRCRQISPYIHSYWKDLHVKNGCVCVDNRITIPNSIKYAEAVHATLPGSWGKTDMAVHAWWPFMHRDLLSKTAKCNNCVQIGKNLKSIIHSIK